MAAEYLDSGGNAAAPRRCLVAEPASDSATLWLNDAVEREVSRIERRLTREPEVELANFAGREAIPGYNSPSDHPRGWLETVLE